MKAKDTARPRPDAVRLDPALAKTAESVGKNHSGLRADPVCDHLKRMSRDVLQRHRACGYFGIRTEVAERSVFHGLCN